MVSVCLVRLPNPPLVLEIVQLGTYVVQQKECFLLSVGKQIAWGTLLLCMTHFRLGSLTRRPPGQYLPNQDADLARC